MRPEKLELKCEIWELALFPYFTRGIWRKPKKKYESESDIFLKKAGHLNVTPPIALMVWCLTTWLARKVTRDSICNFFDYAKKIYFLPSTYFLRYKPFLIIIQLLGFRRFYSLYSGIFDTNKSLLLSWMLFQIKKFVPRNFHRAGPHNNMINMFLF